MAGDTDTLGNGFKASGNPLFIKPVERAKPLEINLQEIFMTYPSRLALLASSAVILTTLMACAPMGTTPVSTSPTSPTYPNNQNAYVEYGRVNNVEIIRTQQPSAGPGVGAVIGGCWVLMISTLFTRPYST